MDTLPERSLIRGRTVCLAMFAILALTHFFSNRPLWLDENLVLENIQKYDYARLLGPLDHAQAFPRVHLLLIKSLASFFGYSPLALRFLPLVCMSAAVLVWMAVFRKVLGNGLYFLLALWGLVASYPMSYYAAEFKPYAADVLVVGLFTFVLMDTKRLERETARPSGRSLVILAGLASSAMFSYASLFVLGWAGLYLFVLAWPRRRFGPFAVYSVCSALALWSVYMTDLRHSLSNNALMGYWDSYFLSTASLGDFMETFWEGIRRLSAWWVGKGDFFMKWSSVLVPFVLYGLVRYGAGRKVPSPVFRLAGCVFLQLFILGLLRKYPFTGERITLFFVPFTILFIVQGLKDLERFRPAWYALTANYVVLLSISMGNTFYEYLRLYAR